MSVCEFSRNRESVRHVPFSCARVQPKPIDWCCSSHWPGENLLNRPFQGSEHVPNLNTQGRRKLADLFHSGTGKTCRFFQNERLVKLADVSGIGGFNTRAELGSEFHAECVFWGVEKCAEFHAGRC